MVSVGECCVVSQCVLHLIGECLFRVVRMYWCVCCVQVFCVMLTRAYCIPLDVRTYAYHSHLHNLCTYVHTYVWYLS